MGHGVQSLNKQTTFSPPMRLALKLRGLQPSRASNRHYNVISLRQLLQIEGVQQECYASKGVQALLKENPMNPLELVFFEVWECVLTVRHGD